MPETPVAQHHFLTVIAQMWEAGTLPRTCGSPHCHIAHDTWCGWWAGERCDCNPAVHIGIDPGLAGAVAILDGSGALVALQDTPVLTLARSRGTTQEYDLPGLVALLAPYAGSQPHVTLEESQAMPGQGVRSMFMVGVGFGVWFALLAALALPYTRVRPAIWKRTLGLSKDKEASRLKAMQLFPTADLRHKKDHGRAEALLLARYGLHTRGGGTPLPPL